ncbi:MAG TPA: DUF262 domain-containing protein [Gaiellaceae bacterium]
MKAEAQSLKRIFQGAMRYTVPLYQRPYVWQYLEDDPENDRLGPFWEDIKQTVDRVVEHGRLLKAAGDPDKLAPMTPHFFGAVVIDQPEKVSGGVVAHEVIDGQQRLTTAQLFIAAAARACEDADRPMHASRLRKLWLQDEDVDVTGDDRFKLRPTRFDREAFSEVMRPDQSLPAGTDRVTAAYRYLSDRLAQWIAELPEGEEDEYFDALRDTTYDQLLVVVIELQPGDNAQGIFESLNAQGERLLAIDLVKNHVFRRARHADLDLERLDTEVWSARFGDDWWRTKVTQGRYSRPRVELFLMHWLTERTAAEVSATGLYVEFSRLFGPEVVGLDRVESFVSDFVNDGGTYRSFDSLDAGSRARLFFARRETLDTGVVFPVALRLWRERASGCVTDEEVTLALRALESWLVRRMVLRLTAQNYNRVLLDLLKAMGEQAADPVGALIGHLRSYDPETLTGWWPDDDAFGNQLTTAPLYTTITRKRLLMLLEAAEARLLTPKTEKVTFDEKLTIEHVIPQTWNDTWPLADPEDLEAFARRQAAIHRLGNLTLLTGSLNPALGNDPWTEKRAALAEHSALRLNARLMNDHPTAFDEDTIDKRGLELAELLITEWPGPGSDVWPGSA